MLRIQCHKEDEVDYLLRQLEKLGISIHLESAQIQVYSEKLNMGDCPLQKMKREMLIW